MKKFLTLLLLASCSSTATIADLKPISQRMDCAQVKEQIDIANEIISASNSEAVDTQVARSGVNVATQAAAIGGVPYASIGSSLFSLGSALYKKDNSDKKLMLEEAQEKKTQLEDMYYDKNC